MREKGDSAVGRNCANCCTDWFAAVFNCPVVAFVESITEDGAWADLTMSADFFSFHFCCDVDVL